MIMHQLMVFSVQIILDRMEFLLQHLPKMEMAEKQVMQLIITKIPDGNQNMVLTMNT